MANKPKHPSRLCCFLSIFLLLKPKEAPGKSASLPHPIGHPQGTCHFPCSIFQIFLQHTHQCSNMLTNFSLQRNHSCCIYFFFVNNILSQSYTGRRSITPSHFSHSLRSYSLCCLLSYWYRIFPLYLPALLSSSVEPSLESSSPQRRNFFTHTHSAPPFPLLCR